MAGGVDADLLAEELKMSCTNVMLQCFDPESRLIYVLGVRFRAVSYTHLDVYKRQVMWCRGEDASLRRRSCS